MKEIIFSFIKRFKNRLGITFRKDIILYRNAKIDSNSVFEGLNTIYYNTEFTNSSIGLASYIASNSIIRHAKIGRFCAIGDNVKIYVGVHPVNKYVSIHPAFFSIRKQAGFTFTENQLFSEHKYVDNEKKYVVEIGNDVWIASNVLIMDGIRIGDGAIVAAGAIVTKDVEPYAIVAGIPAKIIKYRFNNQQIEKLLSIKWWNWNLETIRSNSKYFNDIDEFLRRF